MLSSQRAGRDHAGYGANLRFVRRSSLLWTLAPSRAKLLRDASTRVTMDDQNSRSSAPRRSFALLAILGFAVACSSTPKAATPEPRAPTAAAPKAVVTEPLRIAPEYDHRLDRAGARHLLNRFTFGVSESSLEAAESTTARTWMDRQLDWEAIDDTAANAALERYRDVMLPPHEAREAYLITVRRKSLKGRTFQKLSLDSRRLIQHAQMIQFLRQAVSERQVLEVMVDFWFNHFNVYALKDPVKVLVTDYIEHAIRPHALGRFEDLLIATARHPAMLAYLDNHLSGVAHAGNNSTPAGITENYARELLELHTLGVHGGYTQQDVIEVARVLTGWTIQDLKGKDYAFAFKPEMHDFDAKVVLGIHYVAGRGEQEGVELLKQLAAHPATARRLAAKLCIRFVDASPPPSCVEQLERTYLRTHGDIRVLLTTLAASPEFWQHPRSKLKSPNLFLVSAFRALGTLPRGPGEHAKLANALGEPKLMQPAPTGYVEDAEAWSSTAGMLERMNFAVAVAGRSVPKSPPRVDDARIVDRINQALLAGVATPRTLDTIRSQVAEASDTRQKLRVATALGLGSPDFQYY